MKNKIILVLYSLSVMLCLLYSCALAQDESNAEKAFSDLISQFQQDGLVPLSVGKTISFGNYEDSYTNMGVYQWFPIANADHFVFSVDLAWLSGSTTPNSVTSGCGIVFNANPDTSSHLMVSPRMDGNLHFSGNNNYQYLFYGNYYYGLPAMEGSGNLVLVVDGTTATVFLDGVQMAVRNNLPVFGDSIGLAVLSGTNKDFGTRCTFNNMYMYIWTSDNTN